jgi:Undecaprenyl-phosphate galactose phosphotransferase WbaP
MKQADFERNFKTKYKQTSSFVSGIALMFVDAFILMLCIGSGFFIINAINHSWINFRSFVTYSAYLPAILFVFYAANLYPGILISPEEEVKRFCICSFFCFMGIAVSIQVETSDRWPISAALAIAVPFATILLPVGRELAKRLFARRSWWGVPVIIYSKGGNARTIADRLLHRPDFGYHPALIITDSKNHEDDFEGVPILTESAELFASIKRLNIKVAIICDYDTNIDGIMSYYRYTIIVPKEQIGNTMSLHMRDFGGIMGFSSTNNLTKKGNLAIKRFLDLLLIFVSLPFVIPLVLIISIIIKCTSPGPVFYGHMRVGKNGEPLKTWKFRSMVVDADKQLEHILATDPVRAAEWEKDRKFIDDPRVTKIGKFLRKTSLDEIPQLWNIFLGQMSFVGPRPVTKPELSKYGKYADFVLSVKPGLSGMWQISGRSDTGYEERITLDTYYIQNWSIWLDIWIVIKTIWVVFKGKGAY